MSVRVTTTVTLDQDQMRQLVSGAGSPVFEAVQRGSGRGRDLAKLNLTVAGLVDTGQLRNQIESNVRVEGQDIVGRVTSQAAHTMFVHDGTQGPIFPRRARALRFHVRGSGFVFAAHVRGTKETGNYSPFLTDALEQLTIGDFL